MTPHELGLKIAQQHNVPAHLKHAYATGFARALEKKAALSRGEILAHLKEQGGSDFSLGGGAAMVLHGLRNTTADIDADSDTDDFNARLDRYGNPPVRRSSLGSRVFTIPGTPIDLHEGKPLGKYSPEYNARVQTIKQLLKFYLKLNRPKDQPWIAKLRDAQ